MIPWELRVDVEDGEELSRLANIAGNDIDKWYEYVEQTIGSIIPDNIKQEGFRVAVKKDQVEPTFYQLVPVSIGYTQETE